MGDHRFQFCESPGKKQSETFRSGCCSTGGCHCLARLYLQRHGIDPFCCSGVRRASVLFEFSLAPELASFYLSGDISSEELEIIRQTGAIGSVCGLHFDIQGKQVAKFCSERTVTIQKEQLDRIPIRMGMACGLGKAEPILGALRGKFLTHLVTDSITASQVLKLDDA